VAGSGVRLVMCSPPVVVLCSTGFVLPSLTVRLSMVNRTGSSQGLNGLIRLPVVLLHYRTDKMCRLTGMIFIPDLV
jgi:hypothetical protein